MKTYKTAALTLTCAILLAACSGQSTDAQTVSGQTVQGTVAQESISDAQESDSNTESTPSGSGDTGSSQSTVSQNAETTITSGGTYTYSGTLTDTITVNSKEAVEIVLDNVTMVTDDVCIFVIDGDLTITLQGDNTLSNTTTATVLYEDENIDAVIYAKDDLLVRGDGTLTISSLTHGIVCKDALTLSAKLTIDSEKKAIRGKDAITVDGAILTLNAGTDGMNSDGEIVIESGTITVNAGDDAIHADYLLTVNGGTLDLTAHECLEATVITINDGTITVNASDDGINAAQKVDGVTPEVIINGGDITIAMGAGDTDAIDSNGNLTINGGTLNITAQSPFDYDGQGVFNGGTLIVNGQQVSALTNQFGGGGGFGGGAPGGPGFGGGRGGRGDREERR